MGKLIYQVIVKNIEFEHTNGVLPFSSLIFEILQLQKNILEKNEVLETPRKPIRISYKVFTGTHAKDVEEEGEKAVPTWTSLTPVTKNVAIDSVDNIKLFHFFVF